MKKQIFISFFLLIMLAIAAFPFQASSQQANLVVEAQGEAEADADLLLFQVNITQFHPNAQEAFRRHKEQEAFLTEVLKEDEVDEDNIFANPVSISPVRRQQDGTGYETRQQVTIRMDDVTRFEAMQILLIENGFGSFSGSFSSTKIKETSDEALKLAVEEATRKAELLAEATGRTVGGVTKIEYGSSSTYSPRASGMMMAMEAAVDGGLLQFRQIIPVQEHVRIEFWLE